MLRMITDLAGTNGAFSLADAEFFYPDLMFGEGWQDTARDMFAQSKWKDRLYELIGQLSDGTVYLGSLARGEIQIVGIRRVIAHRFWIEVQYHVLMPPKSPGGEPVPAMFAGIMVAGKFNPGASALIVPDRDHVALVKNYRFHGCHMETLPGQGKGWRLECPRGGTRPGETMEQTAIREATEEAGIVASDGMKAHSLGEVEPDSGILMSTVGLYAVCGVGIDSSKVHLDVTEAPTETVVLEVDQVLEMIKGGEITCSMTIASVMMALLKDIIRSKRFGAAQ